MAAIGVGVIGFLALAAILLYFFQDRIVYFGGRYSSPEPRPFAGIVMLPFETSQGKQYAFYLPPKSELEVPERVLMVFGGNATLALRLSGLAEDFRLSDPNLGVLLVDYPGYGSSEGKPSPETIEENALKAHRILERHIGREEGYLDDKVRVLGHSMGCATSLSYMKHVRPDRAVLVAPFTSLSQMALCRVGWPLCLVLRKDWDNRKNLDALAERANPPRITIFHGTHDLVIPHRMGKELAERHPGFVRFVSVKGAPHGDILFDEVLQILEALGFSANNRAGIQE